MTPTQLRVYWSAILVCTLLLSVTLVTPRTFGEEFRLQLPGLVRDYRYAEPFAVEFDLGCRLSAVTAVRVEITGTHTMGWWDDDDVEGHYHGPEGGWLGVAMNRGAISPFDWLDGTASLDTNGPFSRTITLRQSRAQPNLDFLLDGRSELRMENELLFSAGFGTFTVPPQITLSSVTLVIEAERLFKIISLSHDGTLCWTPMPAQGVVCVQFSPELEGPWSTVASTGSSNTCCKVSFAPGTKTGFYRIVYSQN